jgi:hypothetical protein
VGVGAIAAPQLVTMAHMNVLTSDIQNCRVELTMDIGFTGGIRDQSGAAQEVAACKVSPGDALSIRVLPGGYDYSITGTNISSPRYTAVSNTTAGGGVVVSKTAG